jgi:dipeptidyl aminopeptidase/acylaminoacyl peptidase
MWIIKPPGFDARKKWPLMHVIHGGPHTCFGDTWHWRWNAQLFAAKGWVVAEVNYHGSTGFGQKFVGSINGDWGRRELADVEAGTDYMLKTGYIDAKRIVATGGSYGGYMVAYMNGNASPRYRAYVCHAGCYDWVAMMGSDGYFWFSQELGANHWDDEKRVLKQSPHHYAANFKTPTLVVHGELDYRVPYYQGLAYYNTMRVKDIPTRLVFFPDENHWILKPQNSRLWYQEFFDWCERFTKPTTKKAVSK